jgi:hypothetical protein
MWQGVAARDRRVRAIMQRVARDETRHAALSWDIDRWARTRLSRAAVRRIDRARADAMRQLESAPPYDAELIEQAGLPSPDTHRALLHHFVRALG